MTEEKTKAAIALSTIVYQSILELQSLQEELNLTPVQHVKLGNVIVNLYDYNKAFEEAEDRLAIQSAINNQGYAECIAEREDLREKFFTLKAALEKIVKYKFRGRGPGGCDNHCIEYPCGPCNELPSEKIIARKALEEIE